MEFLRSGKLWAAIFLLVVTVSGGVIFFAEKNRSRGEFAEIAVDGRTVRTVSLSEDGEFEIDTGKGVNKILVEGGRICVEDSDCANRVCVETGWVSKSGENIICAPHKLVITVLGEGSEADAAV